MAMVVAVATVVVGVARGATPAAAAADPVGTLTTYPTGSAAEHPQGITTGPDGNLWFTSDAPSVARMTASGNVTAFTEPALSDPFDITSAPDGNLWFTDPGASLIGRITTAGTIATFTTPELAAPIGITAGPDGNVWFADISADAIGRITPAGVITLFTDPGLVAPGDIAVGGDGGLWFTNDSSTGPVGRIAPDGSFTFPGTSGYQGRSITAAPDGSLWFTTAGGSPGSGDIGHISSVGEPLPSFSSVVTDRPDAVAVGPDGNVWFTTGHRSVASYTPGGTAVDHVDPAIAAIRGITAGPDGRVWFANVGSSTIGAIRAVADGTPTFVVATPGQQRVTLSWQPPAPSAEPAPESYEVRAWSGSPGPVMCVAVGTTTCTVEGLSPGVFLPGLSYRFVVRGLATAWTGPDSPPTEQVQPWNGSAFHPVVPTRILDSRRSDNGFAGRVTSAAARHLQVTGRGGPSNVPPSATAVVMNVTVAGSSDESFLTVYPTGTSKPNTSMLNFGAGQIIPNHVTVRVGTGGQVDIATAVGSTHVVADVVGYYDGSAGDLLNPLTPVRLLDSRTPNGGWGTKLSAGAPRDLVVRQPGNASGVPASATAVVANLTVTGGTAQSFLSAWPSGEPQPIVSNLNFLPGQTIPNLATLKIGANGAIRFANAVGEVDLVVDVVGYFGPFQGGLRFHPIGPTRDLDTRIDKGLVGPQGAGQTRRLLLPDEPGSNVPPQARAVAVNVTVADATAESFVAVFPGNVAFRPDPYSTLNFGRNQVIANHVIVGLGEFGAMNLYNHLGSTELIADVMGFYSPF